MRRKIADQLSLVPTSLAHSHVEELGEISRVLDVNPEAVELIHQDLILGGIDPTVGREGMSADCVLRILIVKQMNSFSYDELAFHLEDSRTYQGFCRLGIGDRIPRKSTLQRNIKKLRPETLVAINRLLIKHAERVGIENGRRVRTDCTEVESNIRIPTDSSLLWDCIRVIAPLLRRTNEYVAVPYTNHSRRAKRRDVAINNAKSNSLRRPLYCDLVKIARRTLGYAEQAISALEKAFPPEALEIPELHQLHQELQHIVGVTKRVVDQTCRRVFDGETVPASEKIVSIFELHTDIIRKARRDTVYGHKLCLTTGASGLVIDCVVERGNPRDSQLAVGAIERLIDTYGHAPKQACFDGGFSSRQNLQDIKALGVTDVAFSKGPGLTVPEMVTSSWVYRVLKRFRAGIEGTISFLKRCFGLRRCTWRSFDSFEAYVFSSVVSANLLIIARAALR